MADETKIEAKVAAEAPAKVAETIANTTEKVVKESAKVAQRTRATATRRAKREAVAQKTAVKAATRRTTRKTRTAARKTAAAAQERIQNVTKNQYFNGLDAIPAFAPFQSLFSDANERSQELVKRSQKVAEELADLARANVEAVVEASRVAAEGARSLGQEAVSSGRDGFEQAADAIRSFAEAKSPTEYLQLQSDFARASFDRALEQQGEPYRLLDRLTGEEVPLSREDFDDLCRVHLYDWLEQVPRSREWGYRRQAYRCMAERLGEAARQAYDRVFAAEAAGGDTG